MPHRWDSLLLTALCLCPRERKKLLEYINWKVTCRLVCLHTRIKLHVNSVIVDDIRVTNIIKGAACFPFTIEYIREQCTFTLSSGGARLRNTEKRSEKNTTTNSTFCIYPQNKCIQCVLTSEQPAKTTNEWVKLYRNQIVWKLFRFEFQSSKFIFNGCCFGDILFMLVIQCHIKWILKISKNDEVRVSPKIIWCSTSLTFMQHFWCLICTNFWCCLEGIWNAIHIECLFGTI